MTLDHFTRLAIVEAKVTALHSRLDHLEDIASTTSAAVEEIATAVLSTKEATS